MKKLLLISVLIVVLSTALFASFSYAPSVHAYLGGSFCHPTADYLEEVQGEDSPVFRTSFSTGIDVISLNFIRNNIEFGTGVSFAWTSSSLPAGISILQEYVGTGFAVAAKYNFGSNFSLGGKVRVLFCRTPLKYKFDVLDLEIDPLFSLSKIKGLETSLICPIILSYKSDSITARFQVGFEIKYDVILKSDRRNNDRRLEINYNVILKSDKSW